ncbi:MAG: EamA/RhaT family transporter [Bacteroidota bacterium]|nr:EamA/RhaT family transporter [Bacteroidota bacterium]
MIEITLTIVTFSLMLIIFKYFEIFKVNNLQAIIVNYITAGVLALVADGSVLTNNFSITNLFQSTFIYYALIIGVLFIITFNLIAFGTQKIGIAITTVSNKMSMIIPVLIGLFVFKEDKNFLKLIGIVLAILAIFFSCSKNGKLSFDKKYLPVIILVFIGQGIADSTLKWAQEFAINASNNNVFFATTFFTAAFSGTLFMMIQLRKITVTLRSLLWGVILGIPNYFTLYFFVEALSARVFESSQVFPIVNMGVIVLTAVMGIILFREHLSKSNLMGILLALIAISLITFSNDFIKFLNLG